MMLKNCPHHADIASRWRALADFAGSFKPVQIPIEPYPSDLRAINGDLRQLAEHVDGLVLAYGELLNSYGPGLGGRHALSFQSVWKDQLWGALEGNATFDVDDSADRLMEEIMEHAR